VLLQHTPSDRVVSVFKEVVLRWPTFRALASADRVQLCRVLRPLGLQRRRALALTAIAAHVVRAWRGVLPDRPDQLRELPGVGPYTAGATIAVARGKAVPFVDAGIARLLRRYFGLPSKPSSDRPVWRLAEQVVRGADARALAWGLLDLSRTVCRARPLCGDCLLRVECKWLRDGPSDTGGRGV
jgi:A/G-specific adenine glycosylase